MFKRNPAAFFRAVSMRAYLLICVKLIFVEAKEQLKPKFIAVINHIGNFGKYFYIFPMEHTTTSACRTAGLQSTQQ